MGSGGAHGDMDGGEGMEKMEGMVTEGIQVENTICEYAKRRSRKGRAMGGTVMAIKRELVEKGKEIEVKEEGL